jgi:hypothetical protein
MIFLVVFSSKRRENYEINEKLFERSDEVAVEV